MADRIRWAAIASTTNEGKLDRHLRHALILVAFGTVIAYAGLIPLGTWHDEYFAFAVQRQQGFLAAWHRMVQWSPRPLSETMIYLYGVAIEHWNRPLIIFAIVPCWLILIAVVLGPCGQHRNNRLAALVLLAMLWLGHPVGEVFYWPFAVFAYLPTAAAVAALLALDWGGWLEHRVGALGILVALTLGAACTEVGAMFCVIYALMAMLAIRRSRPRFALALAAPLSLSLLILYFEFHARVAQGVEVYGDPTIAHHPLKVLQSLLGAIPRQMLLGADVPGATSGKWLPALGSKFAFFIGIYLTVNRRTLAFTRQGQRLRAILAISALLTAATTVAAAFYNFGAVCCERHDTLRQIYVLVALGALASLIAMYRPPEKTMRWPGHLALLLAMLIPLIRTLPAFIHDYAEYTDVLHARQESWRSGNAPGKDMQMVQAPKPQIISSAAVAAGVYQLNGFQGIPNVMLIYFGKQTLTVHPPTPD